MLVGSWEFEGGGGIGGEGERNNYAYALRFLNLRFYIV
jgi:hypothetical protein